MKLTDYSFANDYVIWLIEIKPQFCNKFVDEGGFGVGEEWHHPDGRLTIMKHHHLNEMCE